MTWRFSFSFLVGIIILVIAIPARKETHPDYLAGTDDEPFVPACREAKKPAVAEAERDQAGEDKPGRSPPDPPIR